MTVPRILFYTHGLVDGGGERLWACLATAFKQRGYDVIFAQDFEAEDNKHNLDPAIPVHTLGRNHIAATRRLSQLLKDEKPDIALSAIGGSNLKLLLATMVSRSSTLPVITYHGEMEWKTGWLSYFSYAGLPLLSRWATRTVAVSDGLKFLLKTKWRAYRPRMVTIFNPVFYPRDIQIPDAGQLAARENLILAVGRLVPEKDYLSLIRAFARLKTPDARLIILGKGPEQGRIEAEIRKLNLNGRVVLPGYLKEPWTVYGTAKCFVSSSCSEPFGNVVVEAMAYGLPVVATACSGPHHILDHGTYGRIVGIGNHVQLAEAIDATLAQPGDPARRRTRAEEFSFEARVPAYEDLIREILTEAHVARCAPAPLARPAENAP
ncbi:MAG: glycosyltransferase [Hyphomonas sp.]|nr:glycosyltransferase [Hyphomonas sp.]